MKLKLGFAAILLAIPCSSVASAASDIKISEVLYNPVGVDTGFELVRIKNVGATSQSISGWTLYPDGVGYLTFSDMTVGAGSTVTVYLRASGTNNSSAVYFPGATANMGNTSGSIALFSSATRDESTIVDFVQYGRAGETWESTAEKAGLWTRGQFVPIDTEQEGYVVSRKDTATGLGAWEFVQASSGSSSAGTPPFDGNIATDNTTPSSDSGISSPASQNKTYSGPTPTQKIRAYAGVDQKGIAGAEITFKGSAIGWDDSALSGDQIRYLWNFGDGTLQEGKNTRHRYIYPGTYTATLTIASGEDSARDDARVVIEENPIVIGKVQGGENGFIELHNPSSSKIDMSLWSIANASGEQFHLSDGTFIDARSTITLALSTLGLKSIEGVKLLYPSGQEALVSVGNMTPISFATVSTHSAKNKDESTKSVVASIPLVSAASTERVATTTTQKSQIEQTAMVQSPMQESSSHNLKVLLMSLGLSLSLGGLVFFLRRGMSV